MNISRRHLLGAAAGAAAGLSAFPLNAQGSKFPSKPIQIVIPTAPGGGMDIFARLFGQHLTEHYGQPTVVVSKPGANAAIAAAFVAGAVPDGHTLLLTYSAVQLNTITMPNPGYKWRDLAPITSTVLSPVGLAVNANVPARNMQELIAYVKGNPRTVSYGSYGVGSVAHFMGESLNAAAGIDMRHIPYKGSNPAMMDLIGGQIGVAFGDVGLFSREEQASGRVRVLGVNGEKRLPLLPNIPTFGEQGLSQLDLPAWHGLFAPAATPKAIVDDLAREMARIIQTPAVTTRIREMGFEPFAVTGNAFNDYVDGAGKVLESLFKSGRVKIDS